MIFVKVLPKNKRLKELIKSKGEVWRLIRVEKSVQCFNDMGFFIQSLDYGHSRWCRSDEIEEYSGYPGTDYI